MLETVIIEPNCHLAASLADTSAPTTAELSLALAAAALAPGGPLLTFKDTVKPLIYKSLNSVNTVRERFFVVLYLLYLCLAKRRDILTSEYIS